MDNNYEKIISIIVPVYNVVRYLNRSLGVLKNKHSVT